MLPKLFAGAALLLTFALSGQAQPQRTWTIEDILQQETLSDLEISPDGKRLLWTRRKANLEKDRFETDLFLTYLDRKGPDGLPLTVQLTRSGDNQHGRWSPNGRYIAFLSSRKTSENDKAAGRQLWLLDTFGGEPYRLTELEVPVTDFAWRDSSRIILAARETITFSEQQRKKQKDDAQAVEDTTEFYPVRLFSLSLSSKKMERITENTGKILEFAIDPTGRYIVYSIDPHPVDADARHQPRQYLLDLERQETVEIFTERYFDPERFLWALDGKGFYASDEFASDPENEGAGITKLYYFDLATRTYAEVPLAWEAGVGYGGYQVAEGGVHVQLAHGPRMQSRFYAQGANGWQAYPVSDERLHYSTSLRIGPDGRTIAFVYSRADSLPQYLVGTYRQGRLSEVRPFVRLNAQLQNHPLPRAKVIYWEGAEGDTVNGILYEPFNYQPGRRYPLMVVIHGGPSSVDLDAWRADWTVYPPLWAQRGAFVLRPNYHGSGHHGLKFVESIKGRYYELELPDIIRGIEHLVSQGLVHPDSLGVMGWSNGAILTIALTVAYPERFKVAMPGAGNVNWISDYGNCAFGVRFDDSYFGGPPWERLEHYIAKSPLFRLDRVVTPTLIHFGDQDTAVPTEQGWQHYRALQQLGKAPVRFLLYPGEPHSFQRPSHQKRKMEEDLAWADMYLFGRNPIDLRLRQRILPENAPLTLRLRARAIARAKDGRYGVEHQRLLLPEMVMLDDTLQVSRFEITRAQFRAFHAAYPVPPGTENYPANGLSAEEAQAYVAWLRRQTGQPYRLPTKRELEKLQQLAGPSENTLTYWLGYTPNPDEHKQLEAVLSTIRPDELLMPVGSRPPGNAKDPQAPLLYDLDGNVAEWAVDVGGRLIPWGASAVTARDPRTGETPASPPAFIGLRVVLAHR
ncbi:Dipeptidyl-peptidase 5 [bacterium HR18]|nr:Dipeptidyl-peptidase 5 [bacterium HR18]